MSKKGWSIQGVSTIAHLTGSTAFLGLCAIAASSGTNPEEMFGIRDSFLIVWCLAALFPGSILLLGSTGPHVQLSGGPSDYLLVVGVLIAVLLNSLAFGLITTGFFRLLRIAVGGLQRGKRNRQQPGDGKPDPVSS